MSRLTRRDLLRSGAAGSLGLFLPFAAEARSPAWHARAANGRVDRRALAQLRRALRGRLLLPGDPTYDAAITPANARYDGTKPVAVAQCAGERDVLACVEWSQEHGVDPVARGGGHSYAGFSTTRGLLVDVGALTRVQLDKATGVVTMGGAARNQNVFDATVGGDWILPGGTCLGVGVGGLVLGGGIGYNTHWAGLTADHLVSSRIVTAERRVRRIDADTNRDLFWACRGGAGGSFGINTQWTFQLPRVPRREVAFYRFDWRGADAATAVLRAFDHLLTRAPAALNAVASAQASPVGPGGPREAIDVFSRGQYIGPLEELRELVKPLIDAAGTPVRTQLVTMPYWDMQATFASRELERHAFGDVSRYAARPLPDAVYAKVVDLLAECPSRTAEANGSMWSLGWVGGPIVGRVGRRDTAYVHRDALTLLRATPVWPIDAPRSVRAGLVDWTNRMIGLVEPHTPDESYQNFPNRGIADWEKQYYGENYPRLQRVKARYDPGNLFRNAQSIRPRRARRGV
ncbi:FAD-binding oxidoreductase [Conexibacter stalactiti]|uniref:FAD-binding oxidoreductase n=1 Tax=Conexibacter stalactiti TaxID=1940611 RepID=A0ABU4HP84_9ACTN|nr:FAD-binding oxidoreductase [Conexibacter stalactiti]MDW5595112.1 FAD-binding oxidoreductase [Conexibacter stalactiti]MEC5035754.1 FAD-binding oxidoreductase [Conexibacter stalactiti]